MEIGNHRITEASIAATARTAPVASETVKAEAGMPKLKLTDKTDKQNQESKKLEAGDVKEITQALNKFFQSMNADLHFEIHEGTQRMIVQLVDTAEHKVLKEFPPRDFLDMVAKIREYVGALLDKRA
ncbi:hypothetical protein AXX12_08690 [Anaerosporomusa subterranea]|uniref:Flagellar biosynthesis protein FlaG n=1 Tax=Anaerosporomusa subterranea TaxID=1794912 RepID=A0A154BRQ4_ANASB|nr:flagellar protein FlaG [Anaerosporomusa subterranea]KYZ76500.1 hypothetical protein AXX12_08690 [Anaerosporomusa subterranea]